MLYKLFKVNEHHTEVFFPKEGNEIDINVYKEKCYYKDLKKYWNIDTRYQMLYDDIYSKFTKNLGIGNFALIEIRRHDQMNIVHYENNEYSLIPLGKYCAGMLQYIFRFGKKSEEEQEDYREHDYLGLLIMFKDSEHKIIADLANYYDCLSDYNN